MNYNEQDHPICRVWRQTKLTLTTKMRLCDKGKGKYKGTYT